MDGRTDNLVSTVINNQSVSYSANQSTIIPFLANKIQSVKSSVKQNVILDLTTIRQCFKMNDCIKNKMK